MKRSSWLMITNKTPDLFKDCHPNRLAQFYPIITSPFINTPSHIKYDKHDVIGDLHIPFFCRNWLRFCIIPSNINLRSYLWLSRDRWEVSFQYGWLNYLSSFPETVSIFPKGKDENFILHFWIYFIFKLTSWLIKNTQESSPALI